MMLLADVLLYDGVKIRLCRSRIEFSENLLNDAGRLMVHLLDFEL